ncbi:MAG TPA: hypothetical protein VGG39_05690 [Polyangiaceae bacterium]|jgi:hypothetical protein
MRPVAPDHEAHTVIILSDAQWTRLYKEVLLYALRRTFTKKEKQKWTARDRAQEAVQRACERCLRVDPPDVKDVEGLKSFLLNAVRSELHHYLTHEDVQREKENRAAVERQTIEGKGNKSAEHLRSAVAEREAARRRGAGKMAMLRAELKGDTRALQTVDLIAKGVLEPEDQARQLGCSVEEIYNARKRRARARDRVDQMYRDEDADQDEEKKP